MCVNLECTCQSLTKIIIIISFDEDKDNNIIFKKKKSKRKGWRCSTSGCRKRVRVSEKTKEIGLIDTTRRWSWEYPNSDI